MAAKVTIKVLVKCRVRDPDRFHQTIMYNDLWSVDTDLDMYSIDIESIIDPISEFTLTERALLATVGAHYSVTLENITAAPPSAGSWVQAKGHFDGELSTDEFTVELLRDKLNEIVEYLRKYAEY